MPGWNSSSAEKAAILRQVQIKIVRREFIFFIYRAALAVALPFILLYVAFRCFNNRKYMTNLGEIGRASCRERVYVLV